MHVPLTVFLCAVFSVFCACSVCTVLCAVGFVHAHFVVFGVQTAVYCVCVCGWCLVFGVQYVLCMCSVKCVVWSLQVVLCM